MEDVTKQNPYTREDVLRLIEENGGTAKGLDLSGKVFEEGIDLRNLNLQGIILVGAVFKQATQGELISTGDLLKDAELWGELWGGSRGGARLSRSPLEGADLRYVHLERAGLWDARIEGAAFFDAHLEGADLCGAHLEGADLGGAHLQGAYLCDIKPEDNIKFDDADWGNYILGIENFGDFFEATKVYRCLKQWYTKHGMYDIAGEFFYREMESKRKAIKWWPNPFPRAWSKLLSILCGYGERPFRVVASAAVVVFGLALIYFAIGTLTPSTFPNALYYSAVSFTALGYGSWAPEPIGWVKGLGAFEAFLGVFMMALFLVTFIRKMTR